MQAMVNLIDHGMDLQEAVEAPSLWTQGQKVELEEGFGPAIGKALAARGHDVLPVPPVGGRMKATRFNAAGSMTVPVCGRADCTSIGLDGGLVPGVASIAPGPSRHAGLKTPHASPTPPTL